jgi:hypothetical protein
MDIRIIRVKVYSKLAIWLLRLSKKLDYLSQLYIWKWYGALKEDLITSLEEEVADVYVTLRELRKTNQYVDDKRVSEIIDQKRKRMYERLGVKAESFIF